MLKTDGRDYVALIDIEEGMSTMLAPTRDGGLEPGLRVSGVPYGVVRLQR